jgi:hypothetical protein
LWEAAAKMLVSYSDETFVSQDYARELSHAQSLDVERIADDPPQRVATWLATVDDNALARLDFDLLLDLLRIETAPNAWRDVATVVVAEIERHTRQGTVPLAQRLTYALVAETGESGRAALKPAGQAAVESLAEGPLARHVAAALRTAGDGEVDGFDRLCRTIGPLIIGPLAEALMAEENSRAIRRLREILILFGAAGRETIERLKRSPKATVRRTAVEMLRLFGGPEALPDLSVLLDDRDPQVQRDALKAIVQIGSDEAFGILQKALTTDVTSSGTLIKQLIGLREPRVVPLLCQVLDRTRPRGRVVDTYVQIIDALGSLGPHAASVTTLGEALYRGEWWSPARTATLRRAAASALRRIGSPEALKILDEASTNGSRGVRSAARNSVGTPTRPGREPR